MEYPDDMTAAILCREMGWTWQELQDQPIWFVKNLLSFMSAEAEHNRKQHASK